MSDISVDVYGIKEKDEKYEKMYRAYVSCTNANITIPNEILEYFNLEDENQEPSKEGVEIIITKIAKLHREETKNNYIINLKELSEDFSKIKFSINFD